MMKTVWGDDVKRSTVHLWYKRFKESRCSIQDDPKSGQPVTACNPDHIFRVCELVRADRGLSVHNLASMTGLSIGTVHLILSEDLRMSRIFAKFVSKILSDEMKERRKTTGQEMLDEVENDPDFLSKLLTGTNHGFTRTISTRKCSTRSGKLGISPPIRRKATWKDLA